MSKLTRQITLLSVALSMTLAACSQKKAIDPSKPMITNIENKTVPTEADYASSDTRLQSDVTLQKSQILDRTFLYNADLQYSSSPDTTLDLTLQSMVLGMMPANFRIFGTKLQLVADQRAAFESDINHPERLIQEFSIISQTETTVTIRIERASPVVGTMLDSKATERTSWVRSVDFVAEGNYLMMETSVEALDGSIAEFMESVFPRDTLVPSDYKPMALDDANPFTTRFRILSPGKVYASIDGARTQTEYADRWNIKAGQIVEWYVTPNIPDEYMDSLRAGVEGWNRYSQEMWGKNMIRLVGKLPAGVKIGDPRYNVINWDSVADAGAAYESQSTDPLSGIQSHSLIYLPYAWINIGRDYWKNGEFSDAQQKAAERTAKTIAARTYFGRQARVNCIEDATTQVSQSSRQNPEEFSKSLLKGVIFHEVGHSFGLDHNFKGSLSWDSNDAKTAVTTTIMDYNQYSIERSAFSSLETWKGPLLEYDRQIISALYNDGKDIKDTDAVVPVCNDAETDNVEGGVDPLCIRYDAGHDPTVQLSRTIALLTDDKASIGSTQSLAAALRDLGKNLGDASKLETMDDLKAAIAAQSATMKGLVGFYVGSGAQSLNYMSRANLRSLEIFQSGILPEGYVEADLRSRALDGLKFVANLTELPAASQAGLTDLTAALRAWAQTSPAISKKDAAQQSAALDEALVGFEKAKTYLKSSGSADLLTKVRARVLGSIARVSTAPFFYGTLGALGSVDFESETLKLLQDGITVKVNGATRDASERAALIKALKTYADVAEGQLVIAQVDAALKTELAATKTANDRESIRALLAALEK